LFGRPSASALIVHLFQAELKIKKAALPMATSRRSARVAAPPECRRAGSVQPEDVIRRLEEIPEEVLAASVEDFLGLCDQEPDAAFACLSGLPVNFSTR
jgi:hypothetical protein